MFSFFFTTRFLLFKPRVAVVDLGGGRSSLQLAMNRLSGRGPGNGV
jgi:hypothetical protein